jgi:hypothetical protein
MKIKIVFLILHLFYFFSTVAYSQDTIVNHPKLSNTEKAFFFPESESSQKQVWKRNTIILKAEKAPYLLMLDERGDLVVVQYSVVTKFTDLNGGTLKLDNNGLSLIGFDDEVVFGSPVKPVSVSSRIELTDDGELLLHDIQEDGTESTIILEPKISDIKKEGEYKKKK